jgi:hypothetical protein
MCDVVVRVALLVVVAVVAMSGVARAADCSAGGVGGDLVLDSAQVVVWEEFADNDQRYWACLKPDGEPRALAEISPPDAAVRFVGDFTASGPFVAWEERGHGGGGFSEVVDLRTGATRTMRTRRVVLDTDGSGGAVGVPLQSEAGAQYYPAGSQDAIVVDPLPSNDTALALSSGVVSFTQGSEHYRVRVGGGRVLPGPPRPRAACALLSRRSLRPFSDGFPGSSSPGPSFLTFADWTSRCKWANLTLAYDTGFTSPCRALMLRLLGSSPRLQRFRVRSTSIYRARDGRSLYAIRGGTVLTLSGSSYEDDPRVPVRLAVEALNGLGYPAP